jgi:hypothetical protein
MPTTPLVRNLRDGELVIRDGTSPAPQSLTVLLDEGDLSWTERTRTIEIKDRGSIAAGHLRKGDDESVALSFTAKWTQLLGQAVEPTDPLALYEFLTFQPAAEVASTSPPGQQETLELEFTIRDPAGGPGEVVTFHKVYRETLTLAEGNEANTITFTGRSFETAPTVTRQEE